MKYFNTKRSAFFVLCPEFEPEVLHELDSFLQLLENSTVGNILKEQKNIYKREESTRGRTGYNIFNMFAVTLYGFANDTATLRQLERGCMYDLRYIYLINNEKPSHMSFCSFINDYILPNEEKIFSAVTAEIYKELNYKMEDAFVDGTKIEADANKYKFVWKPTTFHERLDHKIRALLTGCGIRCEISPDALIPSTYLSELMNNVAQGNPKIDSKNITVLAEYLDKLIDYETKERICGPDRNSYYKTDYGATAMCLKEDYYSGLGSNMHAAYNVQITVIHGLIASYLVSQSRSDSRDFPLVIEKFHDFYGFYPKRICADAGYGSLDNYMYLEKHDIENYLKYQSWEGNVSGRQPDYYRLNDDLKTITCLNGKVANQTVIDNHHPHNKNSALYKITGCRKCEFHLYCKRKMKVKSSNYRIFEVNIPMQKYRKEATENLLSPKGIELRVNRSTQVEGAFGVIKEDMCFNRFRRITLLKTSNEFMLTTLAYNVRKFLLQISGNGRDAYWIAPENLEAEQFKKPSAKKLSKRAIKGKKKSVNETARAHKK